MSSKACDGPQVVAVIWFCGAKGQMLAACPNCGQSDTLDNARGEAVSYLTDKALRETALELTTMDDLL